MHELDESDLVVVLVDGRYGHLVDAMHPRFELVFQQFHARVLRQKINNRNLVLELPIVRLSDHVATPDGPLFFILLAGTDIVECIMDGLFK